MHGDTATCEAVQRAVSLARRAAAQEILVSEAIRELADGTDFAFLEYPSFSFDSLLGNVFSVVRRD